MTQLFATFWTAVALLNGTITIQSGYASRYDAGVMQATIQARQEWGHLPHDLTPYAGFVARPYCHEIGDTIWLRRQGEQMFQPYLVADCAQPQDTDGALSWMLNNNILVEVDWHTAVSWDYLHGSVRIEIITTGEDTP